MTEQTQQVSLANMISAYGSTNRTIRGNIVNKNSTIKTIFENKSEIIKNGTELQDFYTKKLNDLEKRQKTIINQAQFYKKPDETAMSTEQSLPTERICKPSLEKFKSFKAPK